MTDGGGLSVSAMLAHADIVVQGVVAVLVLCSLVSWAMIFSKIARIMALRRTVAAVERFAREPGVATPDPLLNLIREEIETERRFGPVVSAEARLRLEAALRTVGSRAVREGESGLSFLATLASTAPFVGLFGTVWGIMHSFTSIAAAQDTSLAAVAPGIAEALLATAVGLGAAIPAVVGYNQIRAALARCGQRIAAASTLIARTAATPP